MTLDEEFNKKFPADENAYIQSGTTYAIQTWFKSYLKDVLESVKLEDATEADGWEMLRLRDCCPGDDAAAGYNQALIDTQAKIVEELKRRGI